MVSKFQANIAPHGITPPEIFFDRRKFLLTLGLGLLPRITGAQATFLNPPFRQPDVFPASRNNDYRLPTTIERQSLTPRETAAALNNFYEFLPGRGGPVWQFTGDFVVEPWKVEITGECENPMTLDLDDFFALNHEERVYHFRCVERWAMNVPWSGFPLNQLLKKVSPLSSARFVRFISEFRADQMPGGKDSPWYPWPYHEGLRMAEAMNDLTMVVTGVYGQPLLKQHGAPVRIIVPWKYGYKSPKSIVRIELLRDQPKTFWQIQPHEYGFLSNVNPNIPHPRWSQTKSFWLDTEESFQTPIFNGYEEQVASLYPDEPRELQRPLRENQIAR